MVGCVGEIQTWKFQILRSIFSPQHILVQTSFTH